MKIPNESVLKDELLLNKTHYSTALKMPEIEISDYAS